MGFHALGRAYMYTLGRICFQTHLGCWSGQFFVAGRVKAWFPFWMSASNCCWQLKPPAFIFTRPLHLQTSNVSNGESTSPTFFLAFLRYNCKIFKVYNVMICYKYILYRDSPLELINTFITSPFWWGGAGWEHLSSTLLANFNYTGQCYQL